MISCSLATVAANASVLPSTQTDSQWFKNSAQLVSDKTNQTTATKAKNVILFVGDGMGVSTLTAARIFEGQQQVGNQGGEENFLSFEQFPKTALVKTYNTNQQTPDSAGTMTAMVTGVKSKAGVLSVSDTSLRANCLSSKGNELITLVDLANAKGLSTGVVSTARLTHATPAASYARSPERNWEADSNLPQEAVANECKDIAYQLVMRDEADALTVALGGGRRNFIPNDVTDGEGKSGRRTDGVDLTQAWTENHSNAAYVWDKAGFDAIDVDATDHLLGLFNSSHMEYEADRLDDTAGEPSLTEMTAKSIELLNKNEQGYLLIVESGRIDHAHHAGNAYRAMMDTVELSNAVRTAVENTNPEETLIMVTADHSHVFTIAGYPKRGNPILGLVHGIDGNVSIAKDGKPYTTVGYTNGPGAVVGVRDDLSSVDTQDKEFKQQALIPTSSETHAGEDITLHATGPGSDLVQGVIEQNVIYHIINQAQALGGSKY
ncbi:alkaline phosphatase [Shewanella fidelis]|uniref:Alkaline phosphatase n=1 Tax=Shewanella fidelis TaxID=173509 RepID=A0AAW8NNB7_9GAMM|nr:alkaline phosphatase [Shewanella fidelis]MDR8524672.1 alkaline phosphatase [Shewanella fidelis]MDW4812147.1 alkaline phosphatase [Shewanella fidelis]MDW4817398.1 alkaline phosphatase [Shewanella fidelis]MDW4821465.1 alkaline phosphatase [Shewanella fidelis]MDW4822754.1 alkaline phosphatase [Shewanella fidelis]